MKFLNYRILEKEVTIPKTADFFPEKLSYKGIYRRDIELSDYIAQDEKLFGKSLKKLEEMFQRDEWVFKYLPFALEVFKRVKKKNNDYELVKLTKMARKDMKLENDSKNFYGYDVAQDGGDFWSPLFGDFHPGLLQDFTGEPELENNEIMNKYRALLNKNQLFNSTEDAFGFLDNYEKMPYHEIDTDFYVIGVEKILD